MAIGINLKSEEEYVGPFKHWIEDGEDCPQIWGTSWDEPDDLFDEPDPDEWTEIADETEPDDDLPLVWHVIPLPDTGEVVFDGDKVGQWIDPSDGLSGLEKLLKEVKSKAGYKKLQYTLAVMLSQGKGRGLVTVRPVNGKHMVFTHIGCFANAIHWFVSLREQGKLG